MRATLHRTGQLLGASECFLFTLASQQVGTFKTELNDGWGLANDGKLLLATDSGHKLYWLDPQQQFKTVKTIEVKVRHESGVLPSAHHHHCHRPLDSCTWKCTWCSNSPANTHQPPFIRLQQGKSQPACFPSARRHISDDSLKRHVLPMAHNMHMPRDVQSAGVDVHWLNELEVVDGDLFANVWQTECIARIDLVSGSVTHWYLMHGLRGALAARPSTKPRLDVLNGVFTHACA
eukprot:354857-Chlamydomonas_euryale.AAC.10